MDKSRSNVIILVASWLNGIDFMNLLGWTLKIEMDFMSVQIFTRESPIYLSSSKYRIMHDNQIHIGSTLVGDGDGGWFIKWITIKLTNWTIFFLHTFQSDEPMIKWMRKNVEFIQINLYIFYYKECSKWWWKLYKKFSSK